MSPEVPSSKVMFSEMMSMETMSFEVMPLEETTVVSIEMEPGSGVETVGSKMGCVAVTPVEVFSVLCYT